MRKRFGGLEFCGNLVFALGLFACAVNIGALAAAFCWLTVANVFWQVAALAIIYIYLIGGEK